MSEIKTIFRRCPNCGRRFEIRLIGKKLVGDQLVRSEVPPPGPESVLLEENVPLVIDEQEFQYAYKCKHCGHEWYEKVEKDKEISGPELE
jgi:DNA-directed RNA polymerase subunit RPC12/RpoP